MYSVPNYKKSMFQIVIGVNKKKLRTNMMTCPKLSINKGSTLNNS